MKEYYLPTNKEEDLNIEKMPTVYLKFLIEIEPVVRNVSEFTDILIWKSTSKSFIVLLIWITLCQWTQVWMVFGFPCFVLMKQLTDRFNLKILRKRSSMGETVVMTQKDLDVSVGQQDSSIQKISINDTLDHVKKIQSFWFHSYWKSVIVDLKQLPAYSYVYAWIIWTVLNYYSNVNTMICFFGSWLLVSCSPPYQLIVYSLKNIVYLYHIAQAIADHHVAFFNYLCSSTPVSNEKGKSNDMTPLHSPTLQNQDDSISRELWRCEIPLIIEVYEHERWWLGLNWTKELLSSERNPWTDNQLRSITSMEDYRFPKDKITTTLTDHHTMKSTIKSWVWNDRDWWIDMTGELENKVDPNGWKYSDNKWQNTMSVPGPHCFTRQRRWCKRAKLIEKQFIYD